MKKTIIGSEIVTTNGQTTRSAAIYVRELRDYTPLPNGFNRELADAVIAAAGANGRALWGQGTWRHIIREDTARTLWDRISPALAEIHAPILEQVPEGAARCGTTMCIAGWAAEISGVDWLVDGYAMARRGSPANEDVLLVRRDDPRFAAVDVVFDADYEWAALMEKDHLRLKQRGFSQKTHKLVAVADVAACLLGIVDEAGIADPLHLFAGGNSWCMVLGTIDAYTELGPNASARDPRAAILKWGLDYANYVADVRITEENQAIAAEYHERGIGHDWHKEQELKASEKVGS